MRKHMENEISVFKYCIWKAVMWKKAQMLCEASQSRNNRCKLGVTDVGSTKKKFSNDQDVSKGNQRLME